MTAPAPTTPKPNQLFTAADYAALAAIVFRPDYPGFASGRGVVESPNGDGVRDDGKRYSHVSTKYLTQMQKGDDKDMVRFYLETAYTHTYRIALHLQVPPAFRPRLEHGALRVLEYPPGAGSAVHTDMNLFTIMCYRDQPECFHMLADDPGPYVRSAALKFDEQLHIGELGELTGVGKATPHWVSASSTAQHSIVYFAMPDHAAVLPGGAATVGQWVDERKARSRYVKE